MNATARHRREPISPAADRKLPHYLTSFVGRKSELAALKRLLARNRMVTLVGPGGAGKSRLAAEVGRATLGLWPDGAWWVDLAFLGDHHQVAGAVASALELPGRGPAQDVVIAWLAPRRALLVLDNCEHLVTACAEFSQAALESCGELTILATSREALGVPGEAQSPVTSLQAADAVPLFEARAALVRPDFKVAAQNLEAVSRICERVDRLPLAIELAASRVGMLTEEEILSQLSDRFHLLSRGNRTAPERQQTMKATIDWSYRLLTHDEALLFRRLSVFRDGFTLESVLAVCGSDLGTSALDVLSGLVQKSMVVADWKQAGGTRYRLLESQLAFAEEKLRPRGELKLMRRRHYEHFRDRLSATASPQLPRPPPSPAEQEWIARESGNLWAAMTWARKNADDLGLSLALDFHLRDMTQARALLEEVLAHSPTGGALRAEALGKAAFLAWAQGDYEAAFQAAEPSVSLRREQGDLEALVNALNLLGMAQQGRGRLAAAAAVYEEASALLKNSTSRTWMTIRNSLGMVAVDSGDYIAASEILTEIVDVARAQRDLWLYSGYLDSLAHAQLGLEDYNAAAASWKEVLKISRDLAEDVTIFLSLEGLGCVAGVTGDDRRALRLAAAANRMARSRSLSADAWLSRRVEESEHRSRGRLGAPKGEEAWNQGWAMTVEQAIDYALSDTEPQGVSDSGLLSRRQQDVVKLVAQGMTNRQIAERLFIAERSAEGHLERITNKLGVRSRAEVAVWAVAHGLAVGPDASGKEGGKRERDPHGSLPAERRDG